MKAGGISQRTLTRWFAHGILGPAPRRGPGVGYTEGQVLRARAAGMLRVDIPSLDEICRLLDRATRAELEAWAERGLPPLSPPEVVPAAVRAAAYPSVTCEHVDLAPGLALVVRADGDPAVRALAQEIYARFGPGRR
jgi:hypothetical protein